MDSPLDIYKRLRDTGFANRVIDGLLSASKSGRIVIDPPLNGRIKIYVNSKGRKKFLGFYYESKQYLVCRHPFERYKTFIINLPCNLLKEAIYG